jgi:hypothetical protein
MRLSMLQAWSLGAAILLVAHGVWFVALQATTFSQTLVLLLWVSPVVAAFVSAYLAPRKKILLGTSMAIPATVLVDVLNSVYQSLGHAVDFPGLRGGLILVTLMLGWNAVLSALGGIAGYFLANAVRGVSKI